jgi:coenzyme F420-reducing hydrogenase beta subunit/polysaccharide pyruvyl transferase WcaK-like protein
MLQSSIKALRDIYGEKLQIYLMSVYPNADKKQVPFNFVKVVSCKPGQLFFITFPLAIIYRLFFWFPIVKKVIYINKIIKYFIRTDLVIDEAGVSFVDSRGLIMNLYAFVQAATPMLLGIPVVKYSQALGEFNSKINKMLARIVLPKMKLICARGEVTKKNLEGIGITDNVKLCADGAFSMPDDPYWSNKINQLCKEDAFYNNKVIGLSLSSVVEKRCKITGINYVQIMTDFIDYLNETGFSVLMIANAARIGSSKSRNNDLLVCGDVYENPRYKDKNRWYNEEMCPEQIRELISHCEALVGSRFHAMIGALEKGIPVLLIGWSHKYKEILDMFNLGKYASDYSSFSFDDLKGQFLDFMNHRDQIINEIKSHINDVKESSKLNIRYISQIIDAIVNKPDNRKLLDYNNPDKYMGEHLFCRKGYAASNEIRQVSSSGGMVTALLCYLLEMKLIDGAWVTKSEIKEGKLGYRTFVAVTKEEIMDCASSIYMYMPLLSHISEIMQFKGRIAVVMLPCQIRTLSKISENNKDIDSGIVLKISLFCGGTQNENGTLIPLKKNRIDINNAERIIYRRGHWRGLAKIFYNEGGEKSLSYTKNFGAYKNAFFFMNGQCFLCKDHYGEAADISFGDVWLKEMKNNPIKHTSCIIRTERARQMYDGAVSSGEIIDSHIGDEKIILSQKRSLVFKHNCAEYKAKMYKNNGYDIKIDTNSKCKWNHKLAVILAYKNMKLSNKYPNRIVKVPKVIIFMYMLFIRLLLNW